MKTYSLNVVHIVFSTKNRKNCLVEPNRSFLYLFVSEYIKSLRSHLYCIGGADDHIHLLIAIHPTVAVADLVKKVKHGTIEIIKTKNIFPGFTGWQDGYVSFSVSYKRLDFAIKFIRNQEEYHFKCTGLEELISLLKANSIKFYPNDLD